MGKPNLIIMCGLQCSGKSTYAKEIHNKNLNSRYLSSDELRKIYPEAKNDFIFKKLYEEMNNSLKLGMDVIIDSTNTTIKMRRSLLSNIKVDCYKKIIIVNTPIEVCKERLSIRNNDKDSHYVPPEVLDRYYKSFEVPFYEEGWDEIEILNKVDVKKAKIWYQDIINKCSTFNQNNYHHTQLLGDHMKSVGDYLTKYLVKNDIYNDELIAAAYSHDIGKLFTQTYKENDPNAHYYNHANVGAYEYLCNTGVYLGEDEVYHYCTDRMLNIVFYINYHMHLNNVKSDKTIKKWKNIFGEDKYNDLLLFQKADHYRGE